MYKLFGSPDTTLLQVKLHTTSSVIKGLKVISFLSMKSVHLLIKGKVILSLVE